MKLENSFTTGSKVTNQISNDLSTNEEVLTYGAQIAEENKAEEETESKPNFEQIKTEVANCLLHYSDTIAENHGQFFMKSVSEDNTFIYLFIDPVGIHHTYKAQWRNDNGIVEINLTEQETL